jgi:signal recognition particle GTPase
MVHIIGPCIWPDDIKIKQKINCRNNFNFNRIASKIKTEEKPAKRPRLDKSIQSNTEMSAMTEAISVAVTAKVMEQLKDSGIIPRNGLNAATSTTYRVIFEQYNQTPEQDITNEGHQTPMTINAPKHYLVASTSQIQADQYSTDAQRQQANIMSIPAQNLV